MFYRCIRGKGSGQIHPWGPRGDAPAPELDSQVREQTSLKDGEWYVLAEKMRLPEGQYWVFSSGVERRSARLPALCGFIPPRGGVWSSRSPRLTPSLVTNGSQVRGTFCLKPRRPWTLGGRSASGGKFHKTQGFSQHPLLGLLGTL